MRCDKCGRNNTRVADSRPRNEGARVYRRRTCRCGEQFVTYEVTDAELRELLAAKEDLSRLHAIFARGAA